MKKLPVYLPESLHKKLKIIAIGKNKTLSELMVGIVENAIADKNFLPKR